MIGPGGGSPQRGDDRMPPMNSQLALRVAIVGSIALLMFAVIFLRLWFLQVLTGHNYVAQANGNITRNVSIAAPRGSILASDGKTVLVDSVKTPAILIQAEQLPKALNTDDPEDLIDQPAADEAMYTRLAKVLGLYTNEQSCPFTLTYDDPHKDDKLTTVKLDPKLPEIPCIIDQHAADITTGTVTIKTQVPSAEQAYISERQSEFPGVEVTETAVSEYPQGDLAAQLLGEVGANSNAETGKRLFKDVPAYDDVGDSGLEYQYNKYLQGKDGAQEVKVNADGEYEGTGATKEPTQGYDLKTSINVPLEKVGDTALEQSIQSNSADDGGAFVAMDPQNGQVYAMGSLPSYNPATLENPSLTQKQYDQEFADNSLDPLFNRATQAVGPDGSTFKVITATAALESMVWTPDKIFDDVGEVCPTPGDPASCVTNAPGDGAQGDINMEQAIEVSDDDFFYTMGELMNPSPDDKAGAALQNWARQFGVGERPDIDLPDASPGEVASPGLIDEQISAEHQCETATGEYSYTNGQGGISAKKLPGYHRSPKHPTGCGIADPDTVEWTVGDNMNAAIGQGDDQLSPLQLAMVYSAIENGGTLVTPHIGEDIQTASGQVVQKINPKPERHLDINPTYLSTIQTGLELAANGPTGTSTDVMSSFGKTVYGKTGTADYDATSGPDKGVDTAYAWYSCYVPSSETNKPIEVVVWVEGGGYGDVAAAPVARQILSQWFYGKPGAYVTGTSTDQ